jgi:hypothetical protein
MGIISKKYQICLLLICFCGFRALAAQPFTKEYRIALVLPFKSVGYHGSLGEVMLDYYAGFRKAAEDLEAEGLKLKLFVFDSEKDSSSLETVFNHPDMKKMDIVVGPAYETGLKYAEKFCEKHHIVLVSPLKFYKPENDKTSIINFFVPDSVKIAAVATKAGRLNRGYQFYIATENTPKSREYAGYMKRALAKLKITKVKNIAWTGGAISSALLAKDSVVILSAISKSGAKESLKNAIKLKQHASVFAHIDWHNPSMNTFKVDEPQVIYPDVNFTRSDDSAAVHFRQNFIEKNYAEPSKYAFIGYDQATYLCYGLMTFGRDFVNHLPDAEYRGFINVIHLQNTPDGIQNVGLNYIVIKEEERREFEP